MEQRKIRRLVLDLLNQVFIIKHMKTYEVEFKSTTYRHYIVEAPSRKFAEEAAVKELQMDTEVSNVWVENAEISAVSADVDEFGNILED